MGLRVDVLAAIEGEILYAKNLGPDRVESHERPHPTGDYLTMLTTYLRKAQDAWTLNAGDEKALHEVRKIAAIAIRCMSDNGVTSREAKVVDAK